MTGPGARRRAENRPRDGAEHRQSSPREAGEHPGVAALLARSHRLGADPRNTNYAGGNTSAKGTATDPVTGEGVELMWVKGSGGDLGTLRPEGLAALRLDRLRALTGVYPGVEREDEMVAAFDYCLHGKGGAAPSIDTAMHGLVRVAHVDHLHPDSGIALACAADGEKLTRSASATASRGSPGGAPASSSAWTSRRCARPVRRRSAASWAATASPPGATPARSASATRCTSSGPPSASSKSGATPSRSGPCGRASGRCPRTSGGSGPPRWPRWCAASSHATAPRSGTTTTRRRCWTSSRTTSTPGWPRWAPPAPTTSCAPRSGRWSSTCPRGPRWRTRWPG